MWPRLWRCCLLRETLLEYPEEIPSLAPYPIRFSFSIQHGPFPFPADSRPSVSCSDRAEEQHQLQIGLLCSRLARARHVEKSESSRGFPPQYWGARGQGEALAKYNKQKGFPQLSQAAHFTF